MIVYVDTSVVLRILFREAKPLRGWGSWEEACTSDLMGVEARRAIDRMRLDAALEAREQPPVEPTSAMPGKP